MRAAMLFARSDLVGGVSVVMRNLCVGLPAHGIDAVAIVGGDGPYLADLEAHGVSYVNLPSLGGPIRPLRDVRALGELRAALKRLRPHLLACHSSKAGVVGRLGARTLGIPAVYTAHGWSFSEGVSPRSAKVRLLIERQMARWLPFPILNVCEWDRKAALDRGLGSPKQHLVVINGIPDIRADLRARPGLDPPHLVMITRFEPQKDPETFLSAVAKLQDRRWTAEIAGGGANLQACRNLAGELGLSERVAFAGPVSNTEELLARGHIFVLTTNWEGLPLTVLEAMRAGLPCVATEVGGVVEAVDDGGTGLLVPRGNVEAVREALAMLIDDAELRVRLGAHARKRYESEFTEDRMLAGVADAYRRIVNEAPRGPWS